MWVFLRLIPNEHRKDGVNNRDLNLGTLPKDKALRVKWNIQEDTLGFIVMMNDKAPTKCGLLAALSSVYDPLGLGAPFLLKSLLILQRLHKNNLSGMSQ